MSLLIKIVLTLTICLSVFNVQAYTIKLSIDNKNGNQSKVIKGQEFCIIYSITCDKEELPVVEKLSAPKKVAGCDINEFRRLGTTSSMSFINGKRNDSFIVNYGLFLTAKKKGKYTYSPIKLDSVLSNKLEYEIVNDIRDSKKDNDEVVKLGTGDENIFLKVELLSKEIYENIPFEYVVKLYTQYDGIRYYDFHSMPKSKHCKLEEIQDASSKYIIEEINGKKYASYIIGRLKITPLKSGKLKIDKGEYEVYLDMPVYYEDSFWGRISTYKTQIFLLDIPMVEFIVKPLKCDIPNDFAGVIGEFNLISKISNENPQINETVLLTYIVAGESDGIEDYIERFVSNLPKDEVEVIAKNTNNNDSLPEGFKILEYFLLPKKEGVYIIPNMSVSYLNTENNQIEIANTKGFKIVIGGHKN